MFQIVDGAYPESVVDEPGVPTPVEGAALVALAVKTVAARLAGRYPDPGVPDFPRLLVTGASFVTLERAGRLRGCIGTIEPRRALYLDVIRNAQLAMIDPRMPPVTVTEWPELDIKVSVLTTPSPVVAADRAALVRALRPGVDGLLITDGNRRATFLPSVWAKMRDPTEFLDTLLAKGGWTRWPDGLTALRYTSTEFVDPAPRPALP
jgi:AmmeMemoRadiSam system protein A